MRGESMSINRYKRDASFQFDISSVVDSQVTTVAVDSLCLRNDWNRDLEVLFMICTSTELLFVCILRYLFYVIGNSLIHFF